MTFKPMTYLISFTLFVVLFMALGMYAGYGKIADHLLAQSFLDASPIRVQVRSEQQGPLLCWEDRLPLKGGGFASITASNRALPILVQYPNEAVTAASAVAVTAIALAPGQCTEDVRVDRNGRYLYARVLTPPTPNTQGITWLFKYDLQRRKLARRTAFNPIMLPVPYKP